MDPNLRLAWTEIVTPDDYDSHMGSVGQAQAAAALTADLIERAALEPGDRLMIAGAGTGQLFDFLDLGVYRSLKLVCTDLNPNFLARLRKRLLARGVNALIIADDLERTAIAKSTAFLLAVLLLEHIDWRRGVEAIAALRPSACGVIIQENPPGMTTAVTPGRPIPPSLAQAMKMAHPKLVSRDELLRAFEFRGYPCAFSDAREVADAKRLVSLLFIRANSQADDTK